MSDQIIKKLTRILEDKYLSILYLRSFNLTKRDKSLKKEVLDDWKMFLSANKMQIIFDKSKEQNKFVTGEEFLLDIINKEPQRIKDKIILKISLDTTYFLEDYESYSAPYPDLRKDITIFYVISDNDELLNNELIVNYKPFSY